MFYNGILLAEASSPVSLYVNYISQEPEERIFENAVFAVVNVEVDTLIKLFSEIEPERILLDNIEYRFEWKNNLLELTVPEGMHTISIYKLFR